MFAAQFLNAPELSACLAPSGCRYQPFERAVMQSHGVTLAFHGEPQDAARQLVRLHRGIADRLERQPRFVESRLQKHERRRIKGAVVEPSHGPSSIVSYGYGHIRVILESFGAKLAGFVTWGRTIWVKWAFDTECRNAGRFCTFHLDISGKDFQEMDQRDQELLDKQLRRLNPPRSDDDIGEPRGVFCWHGARRLPVCLQK
jgi:hypothetical protein